MRAAAPAALASLALACATPPQEPPLTASDGLRVYGAADYDWRLRTLEGAEVRLGKYRDRVLFINLWASWCTPCIAELAGIERLYRSVDDAEVAFLLVSPEEPEAVERFLTRYGYEVPVYLEAEEIPEAFGLRALPTTWIVDRSGRVVLRHRGAAQWDTEAVRAFLLDLART